MSRERHCVFPREGFHQRSLAHFDIAKYFVAVRADKQQPSLLISRVGEIAQVVSDAVIEQWGQRAERHAREDSFSGALDAVGRLTRAHARETAIRHLRDDGGIHQKQLGLTVFADDRKPSVLRLLSIDDVRDRVGHMYADMHAGRVLSTRNRRREGKDDDRSRANYPVEQQCNS